MSGYAADGTPGSAGVGTDNDSKGVSDTREGTGAHGERCPGGDCPHETGEEHRRAVAAFRERRNALAAGRGIPAALAHSAGAARQWISDELTLSARTVAERARGRSAAWLAALCRRTVAVAWSAVGVLLLVQLSTALGAGWTAARTAGLVAAALFAAAVSGAAHLHRARGGALAPIIGADNRMSTSRTVAAGWVLLVSFSVLVVALQLVSASGPLERRALSRGLGLQHGTALLTTVALACAVAVFVSRTVTVRVQGQRLQKVRAHRPHASDLLTDDAGRGSFTDVQYVLVSSVALIFGAVRLARQPEQLPALPWGLTLLVVISAATYLAGKYTEGGRAVVLSVVRSREIGDLHAPIRTGDDIEIRGAGFVPPGSGTPDRLADVVVRVGAVHVHAPLIPHPDGFTSPADAKLIVPVPVEVEPGRVDVQVVTAAGVETNRYPIDVVD